MFRTRRTLCPRRGANAVEFALILPVMMALISGILDYGWFFSNQVTMNAVVRDATRVAATTPRDQDAVAAAEEAVERGFDAAGFVGTVEVTVTLEGSTPDRAVRVVSNSPYTPLVGLAPTPRDLSASLVMRMEEQPK